MKTILLMALLMTTASMANGRRTLDFNVNKVKCTMFGNLKMKIDGLRDELGQSGIKFVKSDTSRKQCKRLLGELKDYVNGHGAYLEVEAQVAQQVVYFERFRRDNPRGGYNYIECHVSKLTDLSFPLTLDSGKTLTFSRNTRVLISVRPGPCPRF